MRFMDSLESKSSQPLLRCGLSDIRLLDDIICSTLRPDSSVHCTASSRRRASAESSVASAFDLADGDQLLRVLGIGFDNVAIKLRARPSSQSPSSSVRERSREQSAGDEIEPRSRVVAPPSSTPSAARMRAASTNCVSLSVTSACSGVSVRSRRTRADSRGWGVEDFHRRRRGRSLPEACTCCGDTGSRRGPARNRACCFRASPTASHTPSAADRAARSARRSSATSSPLAASA